MNGFRRKGYKMKAKDLLFRLKSNLFYKFYNQLCKNGAKIASLHIYGVR